MRPNHAEEKQLMPVQRQAPDVLIVNGQVRSLDARDSTYQAVAVKGETIVGLGTDDELRELADKQTRVIDARGRVVQPAFIDGHTHFHGQALTQAYYIDYEQLRPGNLGEVLRPIRDRAVTLPVGSWIQANNFIEHHLDEHRYPLRWEIDEVAPDHPVVISSIGNHMVAANSLALRAAGITRDTPDPAGGKIDRDASGEPSGVLRERAKLRLDARRADTVVPQPTAEERLHALRAGIRYLHQHGIAGIHEMIRQPMEVADYQALRAMGELRLRVQLLIRGVEAQTRLEDVIALGLQPGFGDQWLKLGGIKLSVDGACVWRNAAVYEPYCDEPENTGIVRIERQELEEKVALCHRAGLRVCVHAIGQRAVDMALDAFEKALEASPRRDHRHRVEHAYLPRRPRQFERMRDLGLILSIQPSFIESFGDGWVSVFGQDALDGVMPLRSALDLGLTVQGNSDFPCSPINPFLHLKSAVARQTRDGRVLDMREAITVPEAMRMLTTGAAYAGFDERTRGSLELGKLADLVVLSRDPYETPPEQLDRVQVDLTMVGGQVVHERAIE
jgi:predicted amidohydrolase YtcJ